MRPDAQRKLLRMLWDPLAIASLDGHKLAQKKRGGARVALNAMRQAPATRPRHRKTSKRDIAL
jgi:hypothetical protein